MRTSIVCRYFHEKSVGTTLQHELHYSTNKRYHVLTILIDIFMLDGGLLCSNTKHLLQNFCQRMKTISVLYHKWLNPYRGLGNLASLPSVFQKLTDAA